MKLSAEQIDTLRNLSRKKAGVEVGWVGIAEARGLTDLGLATRNRSGWQITADGEAILKRQAKVAEADNVITDHRFPGTPGTERP